VLDHALIQRYVIKVQEEGNTFLQSFPLLLSLLFPIDLPHIPLVEMWY